MREQYRANDVVGTRMNFSSDDPAKIAGIVALFQDFCRNHMQQFRLGKAERNQPALESEESGAALPKPARKRYGFGACGEKASRDAPPNCAVLP